MNNKIINLLAACLLVLMGTLAFTSIVDDTLTYDEVAHIGAGYTYWHNQDYRLNPEHPPLVKDLAGLPLQFLNLNFPAAEYWENSAPTPWWTQFDFGDQLLYHSGNDPEKIKLFARIGPILIMLLMGAFLFFWAKKLVGSVWALFLLAIYSFCPNFLAHGRLVTTDVGASFGALFATYFWLKFLKDPRAKNIILAGIAFGLAMLVKFSLILLVPFFGVITLIWTLLQTDKLKSLWQFLWKSFVAALIGVVFVIGPVYALHIAKYPYDKQISDTAMVLRTTSLPVWMQNINIDMAKQPLLRPWAQYLLGLEMATNRTGTGNTTYFEGVVSAKGRLDYFPTLYFVKIPLAFHIMTLIAVCWAIRASFKKRVWQNLVVNVLNTLRKNYELFALFIFLVIYWAASLIGSLNIGLRHILPTFAPTYMLVIAGLAAAMREIKNIKIKSLLFGVISFLLGSFIASSLTIYPHYLSYYNELAGGPDNGYKIAVDSNLDWGQDLKRLDGWISGYNQCNSNELEMTDTKILAAHPYKCSDYKALYDTQNLDHIEQIYVDYFGGGDPQYYLGDKYIKWTGDMDPATIPYGGWLAVSANQMMGQRAIAAPDYDQPTDKYGWLSQYEPPVAKIGYSIFIYRIK